MCVTQGGMITAPSCSIYSKSVFLPITKALDFLSANRPQFVLEALQLLQQQAKPSVHDRKLNKSEKIVRAKISKYILFEI